MNTPAVPTWGAQLTRRTFLHHTARAVAGVAIAAPFVSRGRVLGANDRIGIGFIGVGGRGRGHCATAQGLIKSGQNLQLVAVCDAWRYRLDEAARGGG